VLLLLVLLHAAPHKHAPASEVLHGSAQAAELLVVRGAVSCGCAKGKCVPPKRCRCGHCLRCEAQDCLLVARLVLRPLRRRSCPCSHCHGDAAALWQARQACVCGTGCGGSS
jgi:hypothetical protein